MSGLPPEWQNRNLTDRIEAEPGALAVVTNLVATERTFAESPCPGLLITHPDGTAECTLSEDCSGEIPRHRVQASCTLLEACPVCGRP
jgi:hypothetical protein